MSFRSLILLILAFTAVQPVVGQTSPKLAAISKCASRPIGSAPISGVLASDGDRIYAGTTGGILSAFDSVGLEIQWKAELGGDFASGILIVEGGAVVVTTPSGDAQTTEGATIRLVGRETGISAWSLKIPYAPRYYLGRVNGSIAAISSDGFITLLDRASGKFVSRTGPFGKVSAKPSFTQAAILIATEEKNLIVVSGKDGTLQTKQSAEFVPTAVAFLKNESLAAGDERGNVTLFGAQEAKKIWRFKSGAGISFIGENEAGLLVTSLDNFVYLISDYNGDVIWKKRLTGRVVDGGITLADHFAVLVPSGNAGYVLDLKNGKVTDVISSGDVDLVSRVPVPTVDRTFAVATLFALESYSLGECPSK